VVWRPREGEWLETGVPELVSLGVPESLIRRWTMGDDADRANAVSVASADELDALVVGTQTASQGLMDLLGSGRTDAAAVLAGRLTDAVQEAELKLDQRRYG
jgi:hypothetical protein